MKKVRFSFAHTAAESGLPQLVSCLVTENQQMPWMHWWFSVCMLVLFDKKDSFDICINIHLLAAILPTLFQTTGLCHQKHQSTRILWFWQMNDMKMLFPLSCLLPGTTLLRCEITFVQLSHLTEACPVLKTHVCHWIILDTVSHAWGKQGFLTESIFLLPTLAGLFTKVMSLPLQRSKQSRRTEGTWDVVESSLEKPDGLRFPAFVTS